MTLHDDDTIVAQATAPGRGGVAIVRLSGPLSSQIAQSLCGHSLRVRHAHYGEWTTVDDVIDSGITLYFKGPHSFTGEDIVELQCHGGPVVVERLVKACIDLGARVARPGEFSERAYLNDKIDLVQAEAIADLIASSTEAAARNAVRSLQGEFSKQIHQLVEQLISLRVFVEAAIDFPEEEIDFLSDSHVATDLQTVIATLQTLLHDARQGQLTQEGMTVVIAGEPNAGKSSLLNALTQKESAIVTDIAGTTRDILREHIHIDGMPLHIIDTAGLRESDDIVEQEGIRRAREAIKSADAILLVIDSTKTDTSQSIKTELANMQVGHLPSITIFNKCDLSGHQFGISTTSSNDPIIGISAKSQQGIDSLKQALKQIMGFENPNENGFTARQRHIDALIATLDSLDIGLQQLLAHNAGELLAEDLRIAQDHLNTITGQFTSDDLLGEIFSSFCIGK